jgi:D-alanyl-D-alanine endopeptidase (penicillin-binding protein 7)
VTRSRALRAFGALFALFLFVAPSLADAATTTRRHAATRAHRRVARKPPGGVVWARNAIVLDPATDQILYEKNADNPAPIASLTKLMTALVFLEQNPDLRRDVEVTTTELQGAGHSKLRNHETLSLYDLLHMSLMQSDNAATRVLARESGLSSEEFVDRMNEKAEELGLEHTRYVEFTGLDERNVSTASDIAKLLQVAADNTLIRDITTTPSYFFASGRRLHQVVNTNRLLHSRFCEVNCGKTGFISEAGYCLATWVRTRGRDLIAVVLGAPTNATRFADVVRLVQRTTTSSVAAEARQ